MSTSQYDADFYLWTQEQAKLLRQGLLADVDAKNLAEEIESMGKSDRRAIKSHLVVLLTHLLKWRYQIGHRSNSWRASTRNGRIAITDLLNESPSLKNQLSPLIKRSYPEARENAADETGLPLSTFPEECPFTVEQITGDFWPD